MAQLDLSEGRDEVGSASLKVWLPKQLHRQVRMAAVGRGETLRSYVEATLAREVEREQKDRK